MPASLRLHGERSTTGSSFYLLHGNLWHQPQIFHDGAEGESVELDETLVGPPLFSEVLVGAG